MSVDANNPSNLNEHDTLQMLNYRVGQVQKDMGEMKAVIHKLADAVSKYDLLVQSQSHLQQQLDRVEKDYAKLEIRVTALDHLAPHVQSVPTIETRLRAVETAIINPTRTSLLVDKLLIGVAVLVAMFAANKLGFVV